MKRPYRNALLFTIFVLVVGAASYYEHQLQRAGGSGPAAPGGAGETLTRPAFQLDDLEGRMVPASTWDGQIVLYNFWAAWCPPCRREIPGFNEVREFYRDEGFEVVGIAIDEKEPVTRFLAKLGDIAYPQLIGVTEGSKVMSAFGNAAGGLPYSVLVDRGGVVRYTKRGELTKGELIKQLDQLLGEEGAAD